MNKLDDLLQRAVDREDVPFVVAMVGNSKRVTYSAAFGDIEPGGRCVAEDTVFRIFSMSKALAATAAMVLVDQGRLELDAPVEESVPEFSEIKVLEGFDGDVPILRKPKSKATIRQLATHTSGLEYEVWNSDIFRYLSATKHPSILTGKKAALFYPMATDPGTRWGYGLGIDWLGQVIGAVSGQSPEQFVRDEILDPLDMHDTDVEVRDHMKSRLANVFTRGEDGKFIKIDFEYPPSQPELYGFGHALYSTAPDYMRFLRMLLNQGILDGHRILSADGVTTMLSDHSNGLRFEKMFSVIPEQSVHFDPFEGVHKTYSFGFLRNEADIPGMRSAGSQTWAGVCNTHYWFDPKSDIAAIMMTQSLPFVEPRFIETYSAFERAVYAA